LVVSEERELRCPSEQTETSDRANSPLYQPQRSPGGALVLDQHGEDDRVLTIAVRRNPLSRLGCSVAAYEVSTGGVWKPSPTAVSPPTEDCRGSSSPAATGMPMVRCFSVTDGSILLLLSNVAMLMLSGVVVVEVHKLWMR
jgi:hypothetical protein